jgi:hypothetical protein
VLGCRAVRDAPQADNPCPTVVARFLHNAPHAIEVGGAPSLDIPGSLRKCFNSKLAAKSMGT